MSHQLHHKLDLLSASRDFTKSRIQPFFFIGFCWWGCKWRMHVWLEKTTDWVWTPKDNTDSDLILSWKVLKSKVALIFGCGIFTVFKFVILEFSLCLSFLAHLSTYKLRQSKRDKASTLLFKHGKKEMVFAVGHSPLSLSRSICVRKLGPSYILLKESWGGGAF